jgi:hypothetical protein
MLLARSSNTTNEMSSVKVTSSNQEEPNWVRSACYGSNHEQQMFKQLSYVNQEKTELQNDTQDTDYSFAYLL